MLNKKLMLLAMLALPISLFGLETTVKVNNEPFTLHGDILFQHQSVQRTHDQTHNLTQSQLRFWSDFKIQDNVRLNVMLGTVSDDPREIPSFSDTFNNRSLGVMRAYVEVIQNKSSSLLIGKVKNPIWSPMGILWNPNLNPEGISAVVNQRRSKNLVYNGSYSYFILDDPGAGNAPAVVALQPGITYDMGKNQTLKAAFGFYQFENTKGATLVNASGTNTRELDGSYSGRFQPYVLTAEYSRSDSWIYLPLRKKPLHSPFFSVFGEYVNNLMTSRDNQSAAVGVTFGDKVLAKGNSQISANYRYIQSDSWLDALPNILAYGGSTDVQGYQLKYQYAATDSLTYGFTFSSLDRIKAPSNVEHRFIVQATLKF